MFNTVGEAIAYIRKDMLEKIKGGTTCPCCGTVQKLYTTQLSKAMVKGLLHLTQDFKLGEEFHLTDYFFKLQHPEIKSAADASIYKLVLFNLIEEAPSKAKGYYVYTQKAVDFVTSKAMVPVNVVTYNNVIVDKSRNEVTLKGALKTESNYPASINFSVKI